MIAFVRKNLSFFNFKHTSPVYRSPVSLSLSLHFFSTSKENQQRIAPKVFDILLHRHNFSPELASRVASQVTHLKNPEKVDSLLSFFKESGFSNTQIEKILNYNPRFLLASFEDSIKPKIKIFQDVGFSSHDISRLISRNPAILEISVVNNIIPSLSKLKDLLGSNNGVAGVLSLSPRLLTVNMENTVVTNVEFLRSCGISIERVRIFLRGFPNSFLLKPETMRRSAQKAKEMGLDGSSMKFIYAIQIIASMSNETWELKLKAFKDLGFSESDVLKMFERAPSSFTVSIEKMKKITEVLLATGKFNISCIVNCPMSLKQSVEKRYIPRLQILGVMESRGLIKDWPTLSTVGLLSDDKFFKKFISPYLNEISDVYVVTKTSSSGKNS